MFCYELVCSCNLGPNAKYQNLRKTYSGREVNTPKRGGHVKSGHYILPATPKGSAITESNFISQFLCLVVILSAKAKFTGYKL